MLVSDDYEYEDIPDFISEYVQRSRMSAHGPGFLPWAHPFNTIGVVHGHTIMEDLPVEMKNQIADHIETFHKNPRRY